MKYDLPPLAPLIAFEAAARRLSFTKAADELCVTQAAISFQVRNLEKSLGVILFARQHRALELTQAGADLHGAVQTAFAGLMKEKAAITGRKPRQSFTISAPVSLCSKWLVPRLYRLQETAPDVTLLIDANDNIVDGSEGRVDLTIRYCKINSSPANATVLLDDIVVPVCSPDVAKSRHIPSDIKNVPLLHDQMLDVTWADWVRSVGGEWEATPNDLSFSHTSHAIDAAISGRGLALGRLPLVADDLSIGRLVRPFKKSCQSEYAYFLLTPPLAHQNKGLERITRWLAAEANNTAEMLD